MVQDADLQHLRSFVEVLHDNDGRSLRRMSLRMLLQCHLLYERVDVPRILYVRHDLLHACV